MDDLLEQRKQLVKKTGTSQMEILQPLHGGRSKKIDGQTFETKETWSGYRTWQLGDSAAAA